MIAVNRYRYLSTVNEIRAAVVQVDMGDARRHDRRIQISVRGPNRSKLRIPGFDQSPYVVMDLRTPPFY